MDGKAIYCLKILIFRNEFQLMSDSEINGLIEVAGFIVKCYAVYWFDANKAEKAALNDLEFLKKLENYKIFNKNIADIAITKIINHLYYLSEECVGFSLFDDRIDNATKCKLLAKMSVDATDDDDVDEDEEIPKKLTMRKENLSKFISRDLLTILEDLFSKNSKKVFKRFGISTDFFIKDAHSWNDCDEYKRGKNIVKKLNVVNDSAERGIKLVQEYQGKITNDEEQRQHLLKVRI